MKIALRQVMVAFVATVAVLSLAAPASACQSQNVRCDAISTTVSIPDDTSSYTVQGKACYTGSTRGKTAVVMVCGFSYTSSWYFDPTYQNDQYSQVKAMARKGFVSVAYDQLGTGGLSDNPATANLSLLNQVEVLHQVVTQLKAGQINRMAFNKVVVVGHSLGGQEAMILASLYPSDASAIVSVGYLRVASATGGAALGAIRTQAVNTDRWASASWVGNSWTTADGVSNRTLFYSGSYDQAMITADEANKGVASYYTLLQAQYLRLNAGLTSSVTAPVLDMTGDSDILGCNVSEGLDCSSDAAVVAREQQYFGSSSCFTGASIANTGHDANLHYSAQSLFERQAEWINDVTSGDYSLCA